MTLSNAKQYRRKMKMVGKTCYTANIAYLLVHILYLIFFIISKYTALIIVDAAIIAIYLLFFLLIKKEKYYIYALCCGNLYFAFISVSTIMLGFGTGFHLYLIGLCIVSFFTTYFSKVRNLKGSIVWVGLSFAIYLTLYLVTRFNAPYYVVPQWLEITLFIIHAIAVFIFVAAYMVVFIRYATKLENRIINESRTDELTQISNRYGLYDYYDSDLDKSDSLLALFDIDDFKNINDSYGHVYGDYVLKRVAEITTQTLDDAFICRFGGEEFVVVLNEDKEVSYRDKLETLRKAIEKETFEFNNIKINITITIGAAEYEENMSLDKWVEAADKKMYRGKNSGKNQIVF